MHPQPSLDTGFAAGDTRVLMAPVVGGPGSGLTCGQRVLLDEIQAAPDKAVEGIERAGHPVQRRHPDLSVRVGEAEHAAGQVALLGAHGTQQRPSQQQAGRSHGFGGEERAGGLRQPASGRRDMPGSRRFSPAAGNLPDGSSAAHSPDAAVACSPAGLPGAAGLGGAAWRRLPNHPRPVSQPPASLSHRRRVPMVKAAPKMSCKAHTGVLGRRTGGEPLVVRLEGACSHSSHFGKRDQGFGRCLGGGKALVVHPQGTTALCKSILRSKNGLGRRRQSRGDTWRGTVTSRPLVNHV